MAYDKYSYTKETPEKLKEMARASLQSAEDSFQRSDTDGFLSQWASGLSAQLYQTQAELLEKGGMSDFICLMEGTRKVDAKEVKVANKYRGGYDYLWVLSPAETAKFGRKWIPTGENSRIQKKLGLSEGTEKLPAVAKIVGQGYGLSGTAWVAIVRKTEMED